MRLSLLLCPLFVTAAACEYAAYDSIRTLPERVEQVGDGADAGTTPDDEPKTPVTAELVRIEGGLSPQGCNEAVDTACAADEKPYHAVTLAPFEIDRYEVTQNAFDACVRAGKCTAPSCEWDPSGTPNRPVTCVTWDAAKAFCEYVGLRLPTEAEWERAARRGDSVFPWGNDAASCERAIVNGCGTLANVGTKSGGASGEGAHDLSGNAAEWVADWYAEDGYETRAETSPSGPSGGTDRVVRGGSFQSAADGVRASARGHALPAEAAADRGFRCARSALPK